jgi:hypothetical protein
MSMPTASAKHQRSKRVKVANALDIISVCGTTQRISHSSMKPMMRWARP